MNLVFYEHSLAVLTETWLRVRTRRMRLIIIYRTPRLGSTAASITHTFAAHAFQDRCRLKVSIKLSRQHLGFSLSIASVARKLVRVAYIRQEKP